MNNLVSIILVNYNGFNDTCELIDSLRRVETHPYEVIIVDNASRNRDGERLKDKFPDVTIICSKENLGFAGGNNLGIGKAKGDYLFFLNNDTVITKPVLSVLVECLQRDPNIGCVSPKTTFWPEYTVLQYAGATPMSRITLRNEFLGYGKKDNGEYDRAGGTAFANGAAMMIRRKDIEIFGVMPEDYFLYYEELDWCRRMQEHGFGIWYEPQAVIGHKESASVGLQSPLQVYYHTRNRLIFASRNISGVKDRILSYLYQVLVAVPKKLLVYLFKFEFKLINPLLKGAKDGLSVIRTKRKPG